MKRKRYSEAQIVRVLKEMECGKTFAAVCQEHNVLEQTVYCWKIVYADMR